MRSPQEDEKSGRLHRNLTKHPRDVESSTAWLLETATQEQPHWIGIGGNAKFCWKDNASDALKFADQESATQMLRYVTAWFLNVTVVVTEHLFYKE